MQPPLRSCSSKAGAGRLRRLAAGPAAGTTAAMPRRRPRYACPSAISPAGRGRSSRSPAAQPPTSARSRGSRASVGRPSRRRSSPPVSSVRTPVSAGSPPASQPGSARRRGGGRPCRAALRVVLEVERQPSYHFQRRVRTTAVRDCRDARNRPGRMVGGTAREVDRRAAELRRDGESQDGQQGGPPGRSRGPGSRSSRRRADPRKLNNQRHAKLLVVKPSPYQPTLPRSPKASPSSETRTTTPNRRAAGCAAAAAGRRTRRRQHDLRVVGRDDVGQVSRNEAGATPLIFSSRTDRIRSGRVPEYPVSVGAGARGRRVRVVDLVLVNEQEERPVADRSSHARPLPPAPRGCPRPPPPSCRPSRSRTRRTSGRVPSSCAAARRRSTRRSRSRPRGEAA